MIYFELTDNSAHERDWTVAVSIRPTSHVIKWHCPQCGRSDEYPAGSLDVVLEEGSKFPDFLCCGAYPLLIVSHRAVSALDRAGVHAFQRYPVGIVAIQDSQLKKETAPEYFRIEVTGECIVDLLASGVAVTGVCGRCGELDRKPLTVRPLRILDGSWDGSDLFRDRRTFPRVLFCTQKIVDVVHTSGLTNARFEKMG